MDEPELQARGRWDPWRTLLTLPVLAVGFETCDTGGPHVGWWGHPAGGRWEDVAPGFALPLLVVWGLVGAAWTVVTTEPHVDETLWDTLGPAGHVRAALPVPLFLVSIAAFAVAPGLSILVRGGARTDRQGPCGWG